MDKAAGPRIADYHDTAHPAPCLEHGTTPPPHLKTCMNSAIPLVLFRSEHNKWTCMTVLYLLSCSDLNTISEHAWTVQYRLSCSDLNTISEHAWTVQYLLSCSHLNTISEHAWTVLYLLSCSDLNTISEHAWQNYTSCLVQIWTQLVNMHGQYYTSCLVQIWTQSVNMHKQCYTSCLVQMHSPPLAFWRPPQNSAVTDYVIEAALLISAYLSAELAPTGLALSPPSVLRLWKQHMVAALMYKHLVRPLLV